MNYTDWVCRPVFSYCLLISCYFLLLIVGIDNFAGGRVDVLGCIESRVTYSRDVSCTIGAFVLQSNYLFVLIVSLGIPTTKVY